jgi:hypothetical protein
MSILNTVRIPLPAIGRTGDSIPAGIAGNLTRLFYRLFRQFIQLRRLISHWLLADYDIAAGGILKLVGELSPTS